MENTKLYHGTCMAFVQLAKEKKGKFGPDYDRISFTPNYPHAKMYAESFLTLCDGKNKEEAQSVSREFSLYFFTRGKTKKLTRTAQKGEKIVLLLRPVYGGSEQDGEGIWV